MQVYRRCWPAALPAGVDFLKNFVEQLVLMVRNQNNAQIDLGEDSVNYLGITFQLYSFWLQNIVLLLEFLEQYLLFLKFEMVK